MLKYFQEHPCLAERSSFYLRSLMGSSVGLAVAAGYLSVALVFWEGSKFIYCGNATSFTRIVPIALIFKSGAFAVSGAAVYIEAFVISTNSLRKVFRTIV